MFRLTGDPAEKHFLTQVIRESGQNLLECLQCGKCSGGCPVASKETGGPRKLVAEILSGMKIQAMSNPLWWYCVSCGTCMTRCPVEINMYAVATVLCEMAEKEDIKPGEPDIHLFEKLFLKSVEKYGRVKELRTVATYNLLTMQPWKDLDKGLVLMLRGAVSPLEVFTGWKKNPTISRIFARAKVPGHGE